MASRFIEMNGDGDGRTLEVVRFPVPLEYVVTLAEMSDRITFPRGETPWRQRHDGADELIVLEADHDRAVLLDYRNRLVDDPAVLMVDDLARPLTDATRFENWDELLSRLRFQRSRWDDVAKPHAADLTDTDPR